jgi:L-fucose isomerase-like protein
LRNALGSRILAVGGPGGWAQPAGSVPDLARQRWQLDIQTIAYEELGKLIRAAKADKTAVDQARQRADTYLGLPQTTLETERQYVENSFLLEQVFRRLMAEADCRAITINGCMGTIMPMAETTACLTLSLLNDAGYLAFCESDFVVIPAGLLLENISGRPVFFNNPTYPHDGIITLAHCTAPRRMSGEQLDPARIVTHFESDYGAAPKVEMPLGQTLTNLVPDFKAERWTGLLARIEAVPFLPICRSQIDVRFECSNEVLVRHMPGFHWMSGYGDCLREVGYAIGKIGLKWDNLSQRGV